MMTTTPLWVPKGLRTMVVAFRFWGEGVYGVDVGVWLLYFQGNCVTSKIIDMDAHDWIANLKIYPVLFTTNLPEAASQHYRRRQFRITSTCWAQDDMKIKPVSRLTPNSSKCAAASDLGQKVY